jgi:phosphoribosyl-AMP cyclohydrolase
MLPDIIKFDEKGLIPAIAQDYKTGEVLMMAWMNRESIELTLAEKTVYYFSRSRQKLWKKGEISGQIQQLKEVLIDCDGDAILLKVKQIGVACHTGRKNCFFHKLEDDNKITINQEILISQKKLYGKKDD